MTYFESKCNHNGNGKDVWSVITLEELVDAIVSLGDRTNDLQGETWRLNDRNNSSDSLWGKVIEKLKLANDEKMRHSLYNIWKRNRHNVQKVVEKRKREIQMSSNTTEQVQSENDTASEKNDFSLLPDPSVPLPEYPYTRAYAEENKDETEVKNCNTNQFSLAFSAAEWKVTFSRTHQKMKDNWTTTFYNKLKLSQVTCPVKFITPYIKRGKRKRACRFFCCYATCLLSMCSRKYQISLQEPPDENSSVLFLVKVYGEENHDTNKETAARQLDGVQRLFVGKRANEIGSLAVFRERLNNADDKLLAIGNYTECETIEVLKKAAADYRKKMHVDENIFKECRMISVVYEKGDVSSEHVQGYVHDLGELPLRSHLYTEAQIRRYISYCRREKYSYVHIDATGGVLKKMSDKNSALLYAIMFKDGDDAFDNVPLAHAILTKHTVANIAFLFGTLSEGITSVNNTLLLPSFFIIDFSAAIMNAVLQAFNKEEINNHLNRCWNVLNRKYSAKQLRSLSFIHLCCCHVMHAIARSLTAAHIHKKIRRDVLHIFAYLLCSNDINKLYETLGLLISIFGDPNEQNAQEKLDRVLSLELNVDIESETVLKDSKKIFKKAKKKNDELKLVDEYFRSNTPIIHQSPFNKEAIRRYPTLEKIINKKLKADNSNNILFSPAIIRIIYRWWAYLPLWTGLLWHFEERYSNDVERDVSIVYYPIRCSNAMIESYFRTFKKSVCSGKRSNRPAEIIMALHRTIQAICKADKFSIKQSSKGRKRKKKNTNIQEKWNKRTNDKKHRTAYFKMIDKCATKRVRTKVDTNQSDYITKALSDSEDTRSTISSEDQSKSSANESDACSPSNDSNRSARSCSESSSSSSSLSLSASLSSLSLLPSSSPSSSLSKRNSKVSVVDAHDISVSLGEPVYSNGNCSDASVEFNFSRNSEPEITNSLDCVNNDLSSTADHSLKKSPAETSSQQESLVNGCVMRWPKFGVINSIYDDQRYSLTNTCPIDAALFSLYFLYRTYIDFARELEDLSTSSSYSTLLKTFNLVEKKGWDVARIYWLLAFNVLKRSEKGLKDLYGSLDERVFRFLKEHQRYSSKIICSRLDCPQKERKISSVELTINVGDIFIEIFEEERVGVCTTMVKKVHEISEAKAPKYKYKKGNIPVFNCETNKTEYVEGWLCDSINVQKSVEFDNGNPPLLIVNIEPLRKRSEEGYQPNPVRLRDLKRALRVGQAQYTLGAVIHHKNHHFTATMIDHLHNLYHYDDQIGLRAVRTSTDNIEVAIFIRMHDS